MRKPFRNPASRLSWLWALLPLLLAAALVIPLLNVDVFTGDEPASLVAAGILRTDPFSIADVWQHTPPRHAPGWPTLLSIWGLLAGWNELVIRSLSLFVGLLTLAWVYRVGRDLFTARAGLFAVSLLSASALHLTYMSRADFYALVALCATLCIWFYWRAALRPRLPGKAALAGLLLSCVAMLHTHYLAVFLLPALGLFHLLFVPRDRRWWLVLLVFALALATAALQLPHVSRGLEYTAREVVGAGFLLSQDIPAFLLFTLSHGFINLPGSVGAIPLLAMLLVPALFFLLRTRTRQHLHCFFLLFTSAALLAQAMVVNNVFKIMSTSRVQYLMPLWPLCAVLAGAALARPARRILLPVIGLLALWFLSGAQLLHNTNYRYEQGYFYPQASGDSISAIRTLVNRVPETDFLIMDTSLRKRLAIWFGAKNKGYFYRYKADPYIELRSLVPDWPFVTIMYESQHRLVLADLPRELGLALCERLLDEGGITLDRFALHSVDSCPNLPARLLFDSDIQLTTPEISISDGLLRLDAHFRSEDQQLLARYSLAVHVFDQRGQRVAQGDVGVGPGAIVPLRSEIDVSALPPGDYEVRVALYDWQTGERLPARDLETDEFSDMHTLQRFRLD